MNSQSCNHYETIIVGLGAAGTAAAATLASAGRRVLALEAQNYVGGRVQTVPFGDGVVELGAEWIHGEEGNTVYEQAVKQNITIIPQGVDLITYRSNGHKPSQDIQNLINKLVEQQQCDEMDQPENPGAFGDFVTNHIKQYVRENYPEVFQDLDFIEQLLEFMNLLVNNHNASNDWNDVDAHEQYTALEGNLYLSWHKYGFKTLFDILLNKHNHANGFPSLDIKLNTEVIQICWSQNPQEPVKILCKDAGKDCSITNYSCDNVIVSVSLGVLKERYQTFFKPKLPKEKVEAINNIAMGVMDKIQLCFDVIWWPLDTPFFGFLWRGEDKKKVPKEDYWTTRIFAASRPMGSNNVLTLWTSGEVGKMVEVLPEEEVKRKCRELLQKFMGADIIIPEPCGIIRSTWFSNPFTRGSYTFDSVACAAFPHARADLASPLLDVSGKPRVLFCGEATNTTHFSTVHGAVDTGIVPFKRIWTTLSTMSPQSYDAIIIGLGAAGVTATATLARAGKRVLALEAQDRVGGRVHTVPFGDGVVELGAEWVHGSNPSRVYDEAVKNNIPLLPQDLDLAMFHSNGERADTKYQETMNELVDFMFVHTEGGSDKPEPVGQYATRKLMEYLKSEKPELLKNKEMISMLLDFMNQLTNNYNASNDWDDVSSQSKYESLDGHQHLSWHRHGYKTFFDLLLKDVGYSTLDIKLKTEVSKIDWPQDPSMNVKVTCVNGNVYTAPQVIVTVSLGVLKASHKTLFQPTLSKEKIKAIETISMGVMDKIDLAFDEVWWPLDAVFFCFLWKEEDKKQIPIGDFWTTRVFAASRPMGSRNVLTMWTSGEIGKLVETLPIDEVKRKCRGILQRFMGGNKFTVPEPIAIERSTWFTNPYTRGSYSFDSIHAVHYPEARLHLSTPLVDAAGKPRVLFAGEATELTHFSTVHGASDSGHREAMRILNLSSKI
ncbi:flavin containing amine oxidoreductase domain-containing protein [Phthorimaea operculella]|nr:flavin containing amine oxidoreductase domain-containing protein [Phthorimaea operculella]